MHSLGGRCGLMAGVVALLSLSLGTLLSVPIQSCAFSIRGTFQTMGRGFQDTEAEDHFLLAPGLRIHAYELGLKEVSFHGYFQYFGDSADDFSESGASRLYHGYLKYNKIGFPLKMRAGRFFLFHGVAVGVLDGAEINYKFDPKLAVTAFGGQQGPLSREWEVDRQGDSPMFGGEVRWHAGEMLGIKPTVALSYTRQERDENLLRHLAGLSVSFKLNRRWRSLHVIHLNLESSTLRKALTRWRYITPKVQMSLEGAAIQPYVAAYSYFTDFETGKGLILRLKHTIEYHYIPRKWGVGLSSMVFGSADYSLRTGPYVIFPYGRVGYHYSTGDQSNKSVLWGHLRYAPKSWIDLYAHVARMEYEWEEMNVQTQDITALSAGFSFRPTFLKRTELGLEWQNYTTPEVDYDRRLIVNFLWNFDYTGSQ